MTNTVRPWFDSQNVQTLFDCFSKAGFQFYAVGGCVRNTLFGEPISDIDFSTDALPEQVEALFSETSIKVVPTGIDYGTVTLVVNGAPFEVTTFRRDVATDGRRAVVAFSKDIADDAMRRDLTVNALYADAKGNITDPLGGLPDAEARRIRFICDPETRIREDYLRILRFFRFWAWYGRPEDGIDPEGLAACAALGDGLDQISKERVTVEMVKLLAAPNPAPTVNIMHQSGILARVLPGADPKALAVLIEFEHGMAPDGLRRLAAIFPGNPKDILRLSKADARMLIDLRAAATEQANPMVMGYLLSKRRGLDAWLIRSAMLETRPTASDHVAIQEGAAAEFPVTANMLQNHFQGPQLGKALKAGKAHWIDKGMRLGASEIVDWVVTNITDWQG